MNLLAQGRRLSPDLAHIPGPAFPGGVVSLQGLLEGAIPCLGRLELGLIDAHRGPVFIDKPLALGALGIGVAFQPALGGLIGQFGAMALFV